MVVRGTGLSSSMSQYLVDRIGRLRNVDVRTHTEVDELVADANGALGEAVLRHRVTGALSRLKTRHVFMFIGAEPNTAWLNGCLELDDRGYVLTGLAAEGNAPSPLLPLQTSMPRVFAIGDVRSGSIKRIASAVGEGAAVVAQIHSVISQ
jgi:thioredoxin reductase (NADPH)